MVRKDPPIPKNLTPAKSSSIQGTANNKVPIGTTSGSKRMLVSSARCSTRSKSPGLLQIKP